MAKIWFLYSSNLVSGPFSTDQVQNQLKSGELESTSFIWWKGQREWMSLRVWEAQLAKIIKTEKDKAQSPVWYIDISGSPVGPLTQNEMIYNLRSANNLAKIRLWTAGLNKWTNLFELHDIMDQLGLSRRENERAPLMATVLVSRLSDDPQPMKTKAASISIAGIGLNDALGLLKGEEVNLQIKSPEFSSPLRLKATAIYVTSKGYAGLKFSAAPPEIQSVIFDYIRKFNLPEKKMQAA